eukprot:3404422-Rhodomonas_salina.2
MGTGPVPRRPTPIGAWRTRDALTQTALYTSKSLQSLIQCACRILAQRVSLALAGTRACPRDTIRDLSLTRHGTLREMHARGQVVTAILRYENQMERPLRKSRRLGC